MRKRQLPEKWWSSLHPVLMYRFMVYVRVLIAWCNNDEILPKKISERNGLPDSHNHTQCVILWGLLRDQNIRISLIGDWYSQLRNTCVNVCNCLAPTDCDAWLPKVSEKWVGFRHLSHCGKAGIINWPTKETQFVGVTAFLLISFRHISLGWNCHISPTRRCMLPVS